MRTNLKLVPWVFIIGVALLITIPVFYNAIFKTLAANVTMVVYQQEDGKIFASNTKIDVFKEKAPNGDKIVHPGSNGSYVFAVNNNSSATNLPYQVRIYTTNIAPIPIGGSLALDSVYLIGGPNDKRPIDNVVLSERTISAGKTEYYTFDWQWVFDIDSATDKKDTDLGNVGQDEYTLYIEVTGTMEDPPIPPPITGDSILIGAYVLGGIGIVAFIVLTVFFVKKGRKRQDEENSKDT